MAGTKRAAEDAGEGSAKVTKTSRTAKNGDGAKNTSKKSPAKAALSTADFKEKALPLHVHLTHTPPSILKEGEIDANGNEEGPSESTADIGFIGNLTLVPSSFSTGSYGWKGSKRITVELQHGDTDASSGKEKVQVQLSINATVVGSKPEKAKGKKGKKVAEEEEEEEEDVEEDADAE